MRSHALWGAIGALAMLVGATDAVAQDKQPAQPLRTIEVAQGAKRIIYTEVQPGVWARGQPSKRITSGSFLIIPEAYDYVDAKDGNGR